MIKSFKDRETEKIFNLEFSKKLPTEIQRMAARKLKIVHSAGTIESLNVPPGNRLEALKGSRFGQYSIRINQQWRICFKWHESDAYDVEITDYH
jgi:proteic killer suppression protein